MNYFINKNIWFFTFLLCILVLNGCIQPNSPQEQTKFIVGESGAIILCEGLRYTDNSTITRYDFTTQSYSSDYFSLSNPKQKLGDNANDIVIYDSLCFVSVSGAGTIEIFSLNTGKSVGRLKFPQYVMPRQMCFVNDTLAFVTTYIELSQNDFFVYYFNPKDINENYELTTRKIQVGSHPEGIIYHNGYIYTANSGYGDLQSDHPTASTISVIDINSMTEIKNIKTKQNPSRLYINNKIYAICWGLPSDITNKSCYIIEYDPNNMEILREWQTEAYKLCFSKNGDTLFYLNSTMKGNNSDNASAGVNYILINEKNPTPQPFIKNNNNYEIWTDIAINYERNEMWIANSFRYTTEGEILIYDLNNLQVIKKRISTGIIPNKILFY